MVVHAKELFQMKIVDKPLSKKQKVAAVSLITGAIALPICIFAKVHGK